MIKITYPNHNQPITGGLQSTLMYVTLIQINSYKFMLTSLSSYPNDNQPNI